MRVIASGREVGPAAMAGLEQITQKLQRDVNCLLDDNRSTRRRALERLRKETVQSSPPLANDVMEGLLDFLLKPLLRELSDSVEKCRELAIGIISELCLSIPPEQLSGSLALLLPVLVSRLGQEKVTEPSEELRLQLLHLLSSLMEVCSAEMTPYLDDMILILQRTIVDPYPELKKESCQCVLLVANAIPQVFYQQSSSLVKPLLHAMAHQHSKVRLAAVKALGCVVRQGSATAIDDALSPLAQRVSDSAPSVRNCLVEVLADWLLHQPDRYSYHHKLIPLLLICMCDEVPDIGSKAHDLWDKIGAQFERENEEDLKDQMDFMQLVEPMPGLPFGRPRLGCRVLVYRTFSKILPALLKDITDWTVNSRIKASQLLCTLLYHLEEHATHHITVILNALYRACQDEESVVVEQAVRCSEVVGYYVSVEVWTSLVVPAVKTSAGCHMAASQEQSTVPVGPVQCTSCLTVLAACLQGARQDKLQPFLKTVSECVAASEVGQSESLPLLQQLLHCIAALTSAAATNSHLHSSALFSVLLRIAASPHALTLKLQVEKCMHQLAELQDMTNVLGLYEAHANDIIHSIKNCRGWTINTPDCALFSSLLSGAGHVLGQVLEGVVPVLTQCLDPEGDPEMRLHFITLLIRLLVDAPATIDSQHKFAAFANQILSEILIPNCVWRAGRTAAAIRTASMTCVQALLHGDLLSSDQLSLALDHLMPKLVSCLDDTNESTRLVSCKVLELLLLQKHLWRDVDKLHQVHSDLLKRLDDNSDEVRMAVTRTLAAYASVFPTDYNKDLYRAHTEDLYKGLLVHLDDPSSLIQEAVLVVLKEASRLNPDLLRRQVEDVRHRHREDRYCEDLLDFMKQNC